MSNAEIVELPEVMKLLRLIERCENETELQKFLRRDPATLTDAGKLMHYLARECFNLTNQACHGPTVSAVEKVGLRNALEVCLDEALPLLSVSSRPVAGTGATLPEPHRIYLTVRGKEVLTINRISKPDPKPPENDDE